MSTHQIRIIPIILVKNGNVVQSYNFSEHPIIGQPKHTLKRMLDYQADEVIILDITSNSQSVSNKISRLDLEHQGSKEVGLESILKENVDWLLYPLSVGGGIRTLEQANNLVSSGADKVVLNSSLRANRQLVKECSAHLGSQALVVSLDVVETADNFVIYDHTTRSVLQEPDSLLRQIEDAQSLGCGELLVNNVSRDGMRNGFNEELLEIVVRNSSVPVIVAGGAGSHNDFGKAIAKGVSAVAASNFFHSNELSYPKLKRDLAKIAPVRNFGEPSKRITRERFDIDLSPVEIFNSRIERAELLAADYGKHFPDKRKRFARCKSCLYPIHSATSLSFDSKSICSGCSRVTDFKLRNKSGALGESKLRTILNEGLRSTDNRPYDCVIAVSGGKDSYFQTHFIKNELGLNPLLVTYDANNWTPTGRKNMERMSSVFSVDHEIIAPPTNLLSKMNLLGLILMGDMSWHAHVGITTSPMKVAVERNIPFVFYGEHGREDLSGQFRHGDFPEITYRERIEHDARGYEWTFFEGLMGLAESDLNPWVYPSDKELLDTGVRGLHLGSFIDWDPHRQTELVREKYGFKTSPTKFDRTYRVGSNLDDMHENGLHDWLKYVKFGYGRATDHGSKDIRLGVMGRDTALALAQELDSTMPSDLKRWLEYAGISKNLFFLIANSFRSPEVWSYENGSWHHPEGMEDKWTPDSAFGLDKELKELKARLEQT